VPTFFNVNIDDVNVIMPVALTTTSVSVQSQSALYRATTFNIGVPTLPGYPRVQVGALTGTLGTVPRIQMIITMIPPFIYIKPE